MRIDFAPSARSTVGMEWELALVDRDSGELVQAAPAVLEALRGPDGEAHPRITSEFLQNTVELVSGVHERVADAVADLVDQAEQVRRITDPLGVELVCAGSHPFSKWYDQRVTEKPRYQELLERTRWWGRQMLIWGVHVHVGVEDRRKVLPILNGLLRYYPHLQALSASSPFWEGARTGYASNRTLLFQQLPTAGLPWQFEEWTQYEDYIEQMTRTGVINDFTEVRWDIRPSPHWGTVEMRACDGLSTPWELGAVGALIQCLVESMSRGLDEGRHPVVLPPWYVRENKWRAARYGLDALIVTNPEGDEPLVTDHLRETLHDLAPIADELGCAPELAGVERILTVGASYQRQLAVADAADGDLRAVVSALARELRYSVREG